MKQFLLLFLIIPFTLSARREDPRIPKTAPYDGVKAMEVSYVFVIKSGNDTAITETLQYNEYGYLTNYVYDQHMVKNPPYFISTTYQYQSQDVWTQMTFKNKKITDSIIVRGGWANWYNYRDGKIFEWHEYRGDSTQERVIQGLDTINRTKRRIDYSLDPFWDYRNNVAFASKSLSRSVNSDTTTYMSAQGEGLIRVVNFYDNNFRAVKTDYYNYGLKKFEFMTLPYSEKMDMIFWLMKSRKGKWSFEVRRKFNEKGWLVEEYIDDAGSQRNDLIKLYKYELY